MNKTTIILTTIFVMTLIIIGGIVAFARPVTNQKAFITMLLKANLKDDKAVDEQLQQLPELRNHKLLQLIQDKYKN